MSAAGPSQGAQHRSAQREGTPASGDRRLLDVRGLRVGFGKRDVVRGVDLQLNAGERLALVGESGSGKTVTALSLLRLAQNARVQGQALFASASGDVDLITLPEPGMQELRGREIAMVFQEPMTALNPLFTIGEQIAEVLQVKQALPKERCRDEVIALLARTGIPEPARRAGAYPHQLSGGQRQRAMIAMALACKPALLLADEPTTALDVSVRAQILDLLGELQREQGMAVLLITHDLPLVRRFADRVAVMEDGLIVEQGPVETVFARPQHAYTRRLLDSRPTRDPAAVAPLSGAPAVLEAKALGVSYPVSLPGWRGWWRKGAFVALRDATFSLPRGRTLGDR
jgi:microcin C transport system ATP-binding protein